MTVMTTTTTAASVTSADGTTIGYHTLGKGHGVIVVGGALSTAEDYLPLGRILARSFEVHLIDRRGRGTSGPQGLDYCIEKEVEDLHAVATATGADRVFGHSYGGLVALESARRSAIFTRVAVYEPGVSVDGSIPDGWMPRYAQLLADGDTRGAFACMVREAGFAPQAVGKLPTWYLRAVLRLVIRRRRWQHMEPLLESNLAEHQQVVRLDSTVERYASIKSRVLLMGGTESPEGITIPALDALHEVIPGSMMDIVHGLDHLTPTAKKPELLGERLRSFVGPEPEP